MANIEEFKNAHVFKESILIEAIGSNSLLTLEDVKALSSRVWYALMQKYIKQR